MERSVPCCPDVETYRRNRAVAEQPTVQTIDITPTWRGILPVLVELATRATTVEAMKDAEAELRKMAQAADRYNALAKAWQESSKTSGGRLRAVEFYDRALTIFEETK